MVFFLSIRKTRLKLHQKQKVDNVQAVEWTLDGNYIVVSQGRRNLKLHLYHKDGGGGAHLIDKPDNLKTVEPAFVKMEDTFGIHEEQEHGITMHNYHSIKLLCMIAKQESQTKEQTDMVLLLHQHYHLMENG